ncbi:Ldh family oxidoreductase [Streptomyces sp. NPDC044984]|uniref:Ldh family oxidoreductase n=1 Tax=Streptomyces sp. NPDC044984 TaxID=3154335 RepID=UPI0033C1DBED
MRGGVSPTSRNGCGTGEGHGRGLDDGGHPGIPLHSDAPAGRKHRQNVLLTALDPAAFGGSAADFTAAVDTTLSTLRGLPVAEGADGVPYPGERSAAVTAERDEQGIPVAPKVWREPDESAVRPGARPRLPPYGDDTPGAR